MASSQVIVVAIMGGVDVINHRTCITGLAFTAVNLLFDFLETGLGFPSAP